MFHVELRQSIHQGRRFNLSEAALHAEFLARWVAGEEITIDEHDYAPKKAKLKVFEARELVISELGLGRGWQIVQKEGEDVTEAVLAAARAGSPASGPAAGGGSTGGGAASGGGAAVAEFKSAVLGACSLEPRGLAELVRLAAVQHPGARASECLGLAEMAVWELLHQQRIALHAGADSGPIPPERWEGLVLAWDSWWPESGLVVQAL